MRNLVQSYNKNANKNDISGKKGRVKAQDLIEFYQSPSATPQKAHTKRISRGRIGSVINSSKRELSHISSYTRVRCLSKGNSPIKSSTFRRLYFQKRGKI